MFHYFLYNIQHHTKSRLFKAITKSKSCTLNKPLPHHNSPTTRTHNTLALILCVRSCSAIRLKPVKKNYTIMTCMCGKDLTSPNSLMSPIISQQLRERLHKKRIQNRTRGAVPSGCDFLLTLSRGTKIEVLLGISSNTLLMTNVCPVYSTCLFPQNFKKSRKKTC